MDHPTKNRATAPFKLMLTDLDTLDWIMVDGDIVKAREAYRKYHGRYCGEHYAVYACHPNTNWDGAGGYTIPRGKWSPVMIDHHGRLGA